MSRAADGLLGLDVLSRYDAEIELGRGRVVLHEAVGCTAPRPGWKTPFTRVPLHGTGRLAPRILATVTVDGTPLRALIDTGAERSTISPAAARRLGVSPEALAGGDEIRMVGVGDRTMSYRRHEFATLAVGGQVWPRPALLVGDLPPFVGDMLLGVDVLRNARLWVSWRNAVLFMGRAADKSAFKQPFKARR